MDYAWDFPYEYFSVWSELKSKEIEKYEGNEYTYSGISYGLEMSTLEADKEYSAEELNELGKQAGHIEVDIENEEGLAERVQKAYEEVQKWETEKYMSKTSSHITTYINKEGDYVTMEEP